MKNSRFKRVVLIGYPFFLYLLYCIQFSFILLYYYIRIFDTMEFYSFYFPASQLYIIELYSIIWCFFILFLIEHMFILYYI
nr:MAG TPA: hypothetical protein [Caudoviricetes sp.]